MSDKDDCISRRAAIDALRLIPCDLGKRELEDAIKAVEQLPSAQPEPKWIPCSERLPEQYGNYLVSYRTDYFESDIGTFDPDRINSDTGEWSACDANGFYWVASKGLEVIAWMPLPEPYKGGEQDGCHCQNHIRRVNRMKIGDRVFVRGYIDEIRKDTVIIRNNGGYFGTIPSEVRTGDLPSVQPDNQVHLCDSCKYTYPECPSGSKDVIYGNGKGNDNICVCNKYVPSAQPEIIRCKDCKWYGRVDKRRFYRGMDCLQKHIDTIVPDRDFCSKAERMR